MLKRIQSIASWIVVVILVVGLGFGAAAQKVAVFVQAAAPVPAADLEILKNYAIQRCAVIAGVDVSTSGELMYAQRFTNTYVGNSITVDGMRRLAQTLDAHHIVILRLVRWENKISYKPERSLLLLGATSFLDTPLQLLISPLGLLFGIDKEATVAVFATVFSPNGDVEFSTTVTYADQPLLSLLTADPVEAAKGAIDAALYQVAVAL
jgi:hypothetical protein